MPLDGTHNLGRCIQTQVDSQFGFNELISVQIELNDAISKNPFTKLNKKIKYRKY